MPAPKKSTRKVAARESRCDPPAKRATTAELIERLDGRLTRRLTKLEKLLNLLLAHARADVQRDIHMSTAVEDVKREVAEARGAHASAIALITQLVGMIQDATDLEELKATAQELSDSTDELAAAVTANSPSTGQPTDPGTGGPVEGEQPPVEGTQQQ